MKNLPKEISMNIKTIQNIKSTLNKNMIIYNQREKRIKEIEKELRELKSSNIGNKKLQDEQNQSLIKVIGWLKENEDVKILLKALDIDDFTINESIETLANRNKSLDDLVNPNRPKPE